MRSGDVDALRGHRDIRRGIAAITETSEGAYR